MGGLPFSCSWTRSDHKLLASKASEDEEGDDYEDEEEAGSYPHPKQPTAWHTRTLVSTNTQPTEGAIKTCKESVTALAGEATNQQAMLEAQYQLTTSIQEAGELYHWCFYQMMVDLDHRLASGGPLMDDVATEFFDGMRALWVLARALDTIEGRKLYFNYLQARYVQLSRDVFGRNVEVIGEPMGSMGGKKFFVGEKPAGPAPVE